MISDTIITKILFIDKNVSDYDVVMSSLNNNTLGILYNAETTRNEVITTIQNKNININVDRIGFFCHENANAFLENQTFFGFTNDVLVEKNDNTLFIINLIQTLNLQNIDFLACNTLQHNSWKLFYELLHLETNVIVGASNDATGNIKYGGDWILESTGEDISNVYFSSNIDYYRYLLTQLTVTSSNIDTTYINNTTHSSVVVDSNSNVAYIIQEKFKNNSNITSITFNQPSYVTTIGLWAFNGCSALQYVIGMNSIGTLGWGSFSHIREMGTLYLPNVTWVGGQVFWNTFVGKTGGHASNIVFHYNSTISTHSSSFDTTASYNIYRLNNGTYYRYKDSKTAAEINTNFNSLSNTSYWTSVSSSTNIFQEIYPLLGFDPSWNIQMPSTTVANNTTITVRLTFNCVIFTNQMIAANTDVSLNPITCGTLGTPITRDGLIWDISFNSAATGYFSNASIIFSKSSGVSSVGNSGTINSSASFTVGTPLPPNLSNFTIPNLEYGVNFDVSFNAPTTSSSGAITYSILSSVPANIITLTGTTINNITGAGTVTIRASQAATASYSSGTIDATFTIDKAATSLSNFNLSTRTYGVDTSFNLTAPTSTNNDGPFKYTSFNTNVATISLNTITLSAAPSFSNYITNPIPFKTSANGGTLPSGQISGIAFSADETKVVISEFYNKIVAYSLYDVSNDTWSSFITISPPAADVSGNYLACSLTPDGNRGVVCCYNIGLCYFFTWNGTGYTTLTQTLDNNKRHYSGIDITADGSRIVAIANDYPGGSSTFTTGKIYIATWIDALNNYSAFTVSDTTITTSSTVTFPNNSSAGIGVSSDGSRIVFCDASNNVYWASWNTTNQKYDARIQITGTNPSGSYGRNIRFFNGTNMIFYSVYTSLNVNSLRYSIWNGSSAYNNFVTVALTSVPDQINPWGLFISDSGTIYVSDLLMSPSPIYKTNITNLSITYGNKVTILNAGNTTITARQMASTNYRAATITNTLTVTQASTTITGSFDGSSFVNNQNISKPYGNANVSLSATSNRIGTFTFNYTSSDTNVAEVIDNAGAKQIRIKNTGTTIITISQDDSSNYLAGSTYFNLTVNQITTAITGSFDGTVFTNGQSILKTYGISDVSLSASSASSGNFTFVSDTTDVAEVVDIAGEKKIRIKKVGAAKITISQDASGNYLGNSTFFNLTVNQGSTLITGSFDETVFTNGESITKTYGIPDVSLSATSISDGNFTYVSDAIDVAEVIDIAGAKKIRIKKSGNAKITINQDASGNYLGNSIFFNLTVGKATPTITFNKIEKIYNADSLTIELTNDEFKPNSNSEGSFSYLIFDTQIATVSGTTISILKAGETTITLTQATSDKYLASAVTVELNIIRGTPTVTFNKIEKIYNADSLTIELSDNEFRPISNSEGAFSYSIAPSGIEIATVSGTTISILKAGKTTITLTQAESDKYTSFVVDAELNIIKGTPTISFNDILKKYDANSTTIELSDNEFKPSSNSNGAFSYSIPLSGIEIATVSGSTISILKAGTTDIILYQAESDNYIGLEVTKQLRITKDMPVITFNKIEKTYNADSLTINLSDNEFKPSSNSEGAFSYSILDTQIATVSGTIISILKAGKTTITLTQAGSDKYESDVVIVELNINRGIPTINFNNIEKTYNTDSLTIELSDNEFKPISNSEGAFSYSIAPSGIEIATVSGTTISILKAGETTITLTQAESDKYIASVVTVELKINRGIPTITKPADIYKIYAVDISFNIPNPISNSNGAFSYSISSEGVANISENEVTIVGAGEKIITVNQAISDKYEAGTTSFKLIVSKGPTNVTGYTDGIVFTNGSLITKIFGSNPIILTSTSNRIGTFNTIYSSSNTAIVDISYNSEIGYRAIIKKGGRAIITIKQEESANYLQGSTSFELLVDKDTQNLSNFPDLYNVLGQDLPTITLVNPTSKSDGAFSYVSSDTNVATISGNTVTVLQIGQTTITAIQEATTDYVERTITCELVVKTYPTLSFNNIIKTYGDENFKIEDNDLKPSSNSNGDFSYEVIDKTIADISGNSVLGHSVIIKTGGTTRIRATQVAKDYYLGKSIECILTINRANPFISIFPNLYNVLGKDSPTIVLVRPQTYSDGNFIYASSNTEVATIFNNIVTVLKIGEITITATQQETINYLGGTITCSLVVKAYPILSFNNIIKTYGDENFKIENTLKPSSQSNGEFSYEVVDTSIAVISGNSLLGYTVTIKKGGSTQIRAIQAAKDYYLDNSINCILTVNRATTIMSDFYSSIEKRTTDIPFELLAPRSSRIGDFIYTSSNTAVATISGQTVTIRGAGSTTIMVKQERTDNYEEGTITTSLTVNKTLTVMTNFYASNIEKRNIDEPFALLAPPTSNRPGEFIYSSSNTAVATISGNTVTIIGAGSTTITATQAETDTYAQGTITTILTIKIYPTISNFPNIEKSTIDISFNLLPISDSNGAFSYSSSNESVASIFGNKVIIKAAGQTIITLIQVAKDNYSSGSATCVLTVKKYPTISNFPNIEKNTGDLSFNLIPPDSDSSGTFTYSSSDPTIATISANKVTILRQGTVTISATQAAKDEYSLATITSILTVKIYPTISNFPNIFKTYGDDDFYLPIPDSSSIGGAFTYSSSDNKIAAVFNGNRVRIFKSGLTTIEALQEATDTHSSGTTTCTLLVSKLEPTITFDNIIKTFGDDPFTLDPISLSPGLFTYVSYNPLVATISGNIVTIVGHGTTTIEVSQMETTNYLPKTVTCDLTVNRANPVLINTYINTFGNLHQIDLNTNSAGTFSFTSDNPLVATTFRNETTFENEITIVGAGTVKIDAIQEELNNYNAKTITCNLKINKANSTIDDFENITKNYNDEPFRLLEPNSNSDGYFTYSSSNTAVASILEDIVTIRGTGTTVITAVQEETHIFKEGTISCILTVL